MNYLHVVEVINKMEEKITQIKIDTYTSCFVSEDD